MKTQPTPGATAEAIDWAYILIGKLSDSRRGIGPDYDGEELLADINKHFAPLLARVAELEKENNKWRDEYRLMEHRVVTCGILASHEPLEAVLKEPYTGKWASQQSEKVITLRKQLAAAMAAWKQARMNPKKQ